MGAGVPHLLLLQLPVVSRIVANVQHPCVVRRYAVVPGADEPYGNGGTTSSAAAAAAAVPSMAAHGGQGGDRSPKKARMGGEDGGGFAM